MKGFQQMTSNLCSTPEPPGPVSQLKIDYVTFDDVNVTWTPPRDVDNRVHYQVLLTGPERKTINVNQSWWVWMSFRRVLRGPGGF